MWQTRIRKWSVCQIAGTEAATEQMAAEATRGRGGERGRERAAFSFNTSSFVALAAVAAADDDCFPFHSRSVPILHLQHVGIEPRVACNKRPRMSKGFRLLCYIMSENVRLFQKVTNNNKDNYDINLLPGT